MEHEDLVAIYASTRNSSHASPSPQLQERWPRTARRMPAGIDHCPRLAESRRCARTSKAWKDAAGHRHGKDEQHRASRGHRVGWGLGERATLRIELSMDIPGTWQVPESAQFASLLTKFRASTGRDALARALCLSPQEPKPLKTDMQPCQERKNGKGWRQLRLPHPTLSIGQTWFSDALAVAS